MSPITAITTVKGTRAEKKPLSISSGASPLGESQQKHHDSRCNNSRVNKNTHAKGCLPSPETAEVKQTEEENRPDDRGDVSGLRKTNAVAHKVDDKGDADHQRQQQPGIGQRCRREGRRHCHTGTINPAVHVKQKQRRPPSRWRKGLCAYRVPESIASRGGAVRFFETQKGGQVSRIECS